MALLEIQGVSKTFEDNVVVNNVSVSIERGEFFTLLGPSGCGKTTLLRMIAGFCTPDSGKILLDGVDITKLAPEERPLHTIFQSYALFPHMTVFDNIAFPLKMANVPKDKRIERVEKILDDVRLSKYIKRYPHELSGGQRQRVAIARSLVDRPKLLLLDEPLSALDARLREHMHVELVKLQEESGVTFVYVTHDQSEALALSARLAVMNFGEIEQQGTPQFVYSKPRTYFVADFLGKCNLLKAEVIEVNPKNLLIKVADTLEFYIKYDTTTNKIEVGQHGWYSIRPEKLKTKRKTAVDDEEAFQSTVRVNGYYYYGDATLYILSLKNGTKLQVMLSNTRTRPANFFDEDAEVTVSFDPDAGNFLTE